MDDDRLLQIIENQHTSHKPEGPMGFLARYWWLIVIIVVALVIMGRRKSP